MDFSNETADLLLNMSKNIIVNDEKKQQIFISSTLQPLHIRYNALSDDGEYLFLIEGTQSAKNVLSLSLHFQEDETKVGLLRVDYGGRHKNPETVSENVPSFIRPYAGMLFGYNEHHIHYHIQGYKILAWAVPLTMDSFPIKEIINLKSLQRAIEAFSKQINLRTEIVLEERLFL